MSDKAPNLVEVVRTTLRQYRMLQAGEKALAAVSGGPDSMCLLHVLLELGFAVEVAHFDHQTRHGDSARDADFVRDAAETLGLTVYFESRPIQQEAKAKNQSFEAYARKARYGFLTRVAKERGCAAIATGHHADDQAETVLMRLLRGTGPGGLGGIPPVRMADRVRIVRPLIACTRDDILAYLAERNISYCTDRTNADTSYMRNRIRQELLPQLYDQYNPQLRQVLLRLAEAQRAEDHFLNELAEAVLNNCLDDTGALVRAPFAEMNPALQRRALLLLAWRRGVECSFDQIEKARQFVIQGPTHAACDLGHGLLLRNSRRVTEVLTDLSHRDDTEVVLAAPGETEAFGKRFAVRYLAQAPPEPLAAYCSQSRQVFDADALGTDLRVRHRRPGDRFTPLGMTGSKKIKDYLIEIGLPMTQRNALPILVGNGRIAWIVGYAISDHAAITPNTTRVVEIEVLDKPATRGNHHVQ